MRECTKALASSESRIRNPIYVFRRARLETNRMGRQGRLARVGDGSQGRFRRSLSGLPLGLSRRCHDQTRQLAALGVRKIYDALFRDDSIARALVRRDLSDDG